MAIQTKPTTKTGATNIKNETTPNANTANRVGTQLENQIDSSMYILEDSPTEAFNTELTFDDQRGKFITHTLSGDFTFTLATTGNIIGASIVLTLGPDGTSTVEFSNAFLDVNDNNFNDFDNTKVNKIYMYYDESGRVFVNIRPILVDLVAPTILSGVIASDNSYIDVTFDKGVYSDLLALEPVGLVDFNITFLQNAGSATAWTPTTITKISGGALVGGETAVRINGTITGTADGQETLEIKPATAASIYNRFAVAMADTETTGAVNLSAESIIVLEDDFAGTTIDPAEWVQTDPDLVLSQNGQLIFTPNGTPVTGRANNLTSILALPTPIGAVTFTISNVLSNTADDANWWTGIWLDNANDDEIMILGAAADKSLARVIIKENGSSQYDLTTAQSLNSTFKILKDGNDISYYYWGGASWIQLGATQTVAYGNLYAFFAAANGGNLTPCNVDNFYMTNADFATEFPS